MTEETNGESGDSQKTAECQVKVDDRVRRVGRSGPVGTVKSLREEVIGSSGEAGKKEVLVKIQWDNGTLSYFSPESVEVVD